MAYYHYQGQEMLRVAVERRLGALYGNLAVSVRAARFVGEEGVEIRGVQIAERTLAGPAADLVYVDEIFLTCSTRIADLLAGEFDVSSVVLRRMRFRATRMPDGTWSSAALLPLPDRGGDTPTIAVEDGTIEIVEPRKGTAAQTLTLRDLQLTVSKQPAPAADEGNPDPQPQLRVEGTLAGDHFKQLEFEALISDDAAARWSARGKLLGLRVSRELNAGLPREIARHLTQLDAVQGRADLGFALASGASQDSPLQFAVSGELTEAQVQLPGLAQPLSEVQAGFRCDNRECRVENLVARFGEAKLLLSATRFGLTDDSPLTLTVAARNLQLDNQLPAALPEMLQPVWQKFSPAGVVDADLQLDFDGRQWTRDVTVRCRDVSLSYERFPYRLHHGTGTVHLVGDRLNVNLRTVAGESPVRIEGSFLNAGSDFTGELLVESEGLIAIDKDLINALDMPTQRVVRPFGIRGWMRLVARMQWRSPGAEPTNYLLMTLHDCALLYDKFPYPISQIRGTLEMNGQHWSIRDLEGRNDSAYITCAGRWLPTEPEGGQLTLDLVGSDIPLEDELRDAVNPAARQLWASLQPRGTVDHVGVNLTYRTSDGRLGLDVRAQKWAQSQNVEGRTITIQPESFPYRMDHLTGSIHYRDGQINLTDLRATHGQVTLSADGYCRVVAGGSWQLQFERFAADRLTCDQELIAALPSRLGRAVDRLNLEGALNVSGRLQLDGCGGAQNLASNWDMVLDIENGSLGRGTRVEHIHGGLRCVGYNQGEQFNAQGELAIDSLMWQGQQFTQVRGPLLLDGSQLLCGAWARPRQGAADQVRRLTAGLFGGRFEADARLAFDDQGRFDVDARLIDSDLATLAQEAMSRQHRISGKAYGTLKLTGNCLGTYSLKGGGQVQLVDADIYEVPIMVALLKILSVRRPDTTAFTESQIDYRIDGEHIYLDRIDFHGDMITLKGKGSVGLDRYIEGLEFYTLVGPDALRPRILSPILGEASRQLLVIRVAGSLDDPKTSKDAFPALNETLQRLFPEMARREEERQSQLPRPRGILQGAGLLPRR